MQPSRLDPDFDSMTYRSAPVASNDAPSVRERELWCAVLLQAFVDMGNPSQAENKHIAQRHAQEFLLNDRKDMPVVCDLAGISASTIRDAARLMVAGRIKFYVPMQGQQKGRSLG
jgi:hypothetical protein